MMEETMAVNAVRLSEEIMKAAIKHAPINSRSVPKQIDHWAKIGKITEENPDLPYQFIKGILEAKDEMDRGDVTEFIFRNSPPAPELDEASLLKR